MAFDIPRRNSADSADSGDARADALDIARDILKALDMLCETPGQADRAPAPQLDNDKYGDAHNSIPVSLDSTVPTARRLEQSLKGAFSPWTSDATRADRLGEAGETTQRLREQLLPRRADSPEQAKSREGILAQTEKLNSLLAATLAPEHSPGIDRAGPHPATLDVVSPSHGRVRVSGLAQFFPAHAVHARRSTAVVTGDNCELQSVDHYHVRRVTVSLDPLMERGSPGHIALQRLIEDPTDRGIARFQRSMGGIVRPVEQRQTQASVPVRLRHLTSVTSSEMVQQGSESRTDLVTHYMVEESELPIVDLLARDSGLVRSLAAAATADESTHGPATQQFLRRTARCAGHADDLTLLEHSSDLHTPDTLLLGLFGVDIADQASVVMVGSGNRLDQDMAVHRSRLSAGTVLDDIGRLREQTAPARAVQPPVAPIEVRVPRPTPWQPRPPGYDTTNPGGSTPRAPRDPGRW
jgi:hypothetical protein